MKAGWRWHQIDLSSYRAAYNKPPPPLKQAQSLVSDRQKAQRYAALVQRQRRISSGCRRCAVDL